jgi:isoamylase
MEMTQADWADPNALALAIYLDGSDDPDHGPDGRPLIDDDFLVLVNAWWEPIEFAIPVTRAGTQWQQEIDSYEPAAPSGSPQPAGAQVTVGPRSVCVLRGSLPPPPGTPAGP